MDPRATVGLTAESPVDPIGSVVAQRGNESAAGETNERATRAYSGRLRRAFER
jgi:hypothetical protein